MESYNPKRVIQIVSGSRSGSSLLKSILAKSPDLRSLDGEEEPYFGLTGNGFGLTSDSDEFDTLLDSAAFNRSVVREFDSRLSLRSAWDWRLRLQYRGEKLDRLLASLDDLWEGKEDRWLAAQGIAGHYDGCPREDRQEFMEIAYEMPPFVRPSLAASKITNADTLLLKCPYNLFRPEIMRSVFPTSEFTKVVITRNPAATINGLIDAWNSPYGFHKHLTSWGWWKFDATDGWRDRVQWSAEGKSYYQWKTAARALLGHDNEIHVRLEDLLTDRETTIQGLCRKLDITPPSVVELPLVMSTDQPEPYRWRRREAVIKKLLAGDGELIKAFHYEDISTWL